MLVPVLTVVGELYAVFLILRYVHQLYDHRKQARSLHCQPPAEGYSILFGIPAFIRMSTAVKEKRWVEYIASMYAEHGNTFAQTIFARRMVATIEPENIKALLATQFDEFGLGTRHKEFYPLLGDGIFTLDGAGWTHARALLRPQFSRDQFADLALLDDHVSHMIDLIPRDRSSFDIQRLFFMLTMDSATHFLFGESVGCLNPASTTTGVLEKSAVGGAQGFAYAFNLAQDYLAARSRAFNFYWMINPKEFQDANRKIHEVVDHYVYAALASKRNPDKKPVNDRYIFLEALAAETDDPKVLRDNLLNILLAGREPTASLLSSVFFYLSRSPAVWNKLRQEIVKEFGDDQQSRGEITQTKLKDIPYLRYVLNEVLRLLPPVPMNFRIANQDTSLPVGGGPDQKSPVFIQKGTLVIYSVYTMHRRTDFWGKDSHLFRPERWEENAKHGWEYLPFNGGPRICLGQQYALTEASYTLVKLMLHFDMLENADPPIRMEPLLQSNLNMSHDSGVFVRLYSSKRQ